MVARSQLSETAEPTEIRNLAERFEALVVANASILRALPPAAPPASPVAPVRGMIGRVLYIAAFTRPAGPHTDIQCRNRKRQNNFSNRQRRREDTANDPNS